MKRRDGFTLIEILAAVAIMSVVAIVATSLFYTGSNTYVKSEKSMEIKQNVRSAMEVITSDIKKVGDTSKISIKDIIRGGKTYKALYVDNNVYYYDGSKNSICMNNNDGQELANEVKSFTFSIDGRKVTVIITGTDGFTLNNAVYLPK
ncbi:MAG: prepilin-type N-terminal cleavage/methylation domain-containing protein [Thermoanaerobacteraceae bacterium]|nr:prepilin-type N-terminal cleavage/methylation domain-containing protein [Thermoanaerobacteraceae bacterium]